MKVAPSFEKVLITIIKKTVLINVTCTQTYCILTEDMILALAGQFKQLSHEPEKIQVTQRDSNP